MLKQILFGGESGLSWQANAGLTLLRIFAGVALLMSHGMGKIPPSEGVIGNAASMGFPLPTLFAWAAALSESLGGAFLALGLFTRVSSFFILCTMLTALLGVHRNDPFGKQELAFLYFFISLAFLIMGANDWSFDRFLRK
ncbi:MAG: DoxX family protein [Pyrinomonadaceae bacterium]